MRRLVPAVLETHQLHATTHCSRGCDKPITLGHGSATDGPSATATPLCRGRGACAAVPRQARGIDRSRRSRRPVADPVSPLPFDILLIEHGQSGVDALAVLSDSGRENSIYRSLSLPNGMRTLRQSACTRRERLRHQVDGVLPGHLLSTSSFEGSRRLASGARQNQGPANRGCRSQRPQPRRTHPTGFRASGRARNRRSIGCARPSLPFSGSVKAGLQTPSLQRRSLPIGNRLLRRKAASSRDNGREVSSSDSPIAKQRCATRRRGRRPRERRRKMLLGVRSNSRRTSLKPRRFVGRLSEAGSCERLAPCRTARA